MSDRSDGEAVAGSPRLNLGAEDKLLPVLEVEEVGDPMLT